MVPNARFAEARVLHSQTEEQVMYPAAIPVGERVARNAGASRQSNLHDALQGKSGERRAAA